MKLSVHLYQLLIYLCILILLPACGGGGGGTTGGARVIYVSDTSGDDTFDGQRPGTSKKTISAGIAAATGSTQVRVAAGTYFITTSIVLAPDVSILGGYSTDFSVRDAASNITTIQHTVNSAAVNTVIESNDVRIDNGTIVDGFTLDGGNSDTQSFGADFIDGSPTIQNNIIIGGQGSGRTGIRISSGSPQIINNTITDVGLGIFVTLAAASPVISNNTITVDSDTFTAGINITSLSGITNTVINNNTIYGGNAAGTSNNSIGIWTSATTTMITNNTIDAGSVNDGANGATNGIRVSGGTATIYNNLIYGGDGGSRSVGIEVYLTANIYNNTIDGGSGILSSAVLTDTVTATSILKNNILMATSGANNYCVYEDSNAPLEIKNNNFINCSTSAYYDDDTLCPGSDNTCDIVEMEALVDITGGASGNVSLDPMFVAADGGDSTILSSNDWHLTTDAPTYTNANVLEGGLDLSAIFTIDKEAQTRTTGVSKGAGNNGAAGWSMGAFEFD